MVIFNGSELARQREEQLKIRIENEFPQDQLTIAAVLFSEDLGSQLYTRLKREAAQRVGINYSVYEFSLHDPIAKILETITKLNGSSEITGIIIQKPWKKTWYTVRGEEIDANYTQYDSWWHSLVESIEEGKDVDGLHPQTALEIKNGTWLESGKVLPATCQAVLTILDQAQQYHETHAALSRKYIILGRSDLLGIPLYYELLRQGKEVQLLTSQEFEMRISSGQKLLDAGVIISATGKKHLITRDMVASGCVIIDVGEPKPDVDLVSIGEKASFITPVPGGVGPLTVVSLLENCVSLSK